MICNLRKVEIVMKLNSIYSNRDLSSSKLLYRVVRRIVNDCLRSIEISSSWLKGRVRMLKLRIVIRMLI